MPELLAHPFQDPFFAALATRRGIRRADLPRRYPIGREWGNDGGITELPGMRPFTFIAGHESDGFGLMAIYPDGFRYRREDEAVAQVILDLELPETVRLALAGRSCSDVVDAPVIGSWRILHAGPHPDDEGETQLLLRVPR